MEWKELLQEIKLADYTERENGTDKYHVSSFEKDYESIVSSAAFRRLQDKTQVFPLAKSDFVRTRLTHSLEVSTIAKQLGIMCFGDTSEYSHPPIDEDEKGRYSQTEEQALKVKRVSDIEAILSCAGLLHDLGNPPFGHAGETIIGEWFKNNLDKIGYLENSEKKCLSAKAVGDLKNFEGNAQTLRILLKARFQQEISEYQKEIDKYKKEITRYRQDIPEFQQEIIKCKKEIAKCKKEIDRCRQETNLPYSIISTLVKYPTDCKQADKEASSVARHKMGYFQSEKNVFDEISKAVGTKTGDTTIVRHPLAYLVEAADDIAYMTADLEDAVISGVVSINELLTFFEEQIHEYEENKNDTKYTKMMFDKLKDLSSEGKDKTRIMGQWGIYTRRWLMNAACYQFSNSYGEILNGTYENDLFDGTYHSSTVALLKGAMKEFVFGSQIIVEPEIAAQNILNFLLDKIVPAVVRFDGHGEMSPEDKKVLTLIPQNYIDDYHSVIRQANKDKIKMDEGEMLYHRILIATDYISSLTDGYARILYRKLSGID